MRTISSFHMVGILGSHPEQLSGEGKASYVRLSISQDTRDGDSRWAKVFAFEKTADIALSYARKGAEIYVQGHLEPRTMEVNGKTISVIAAVANRLEVLRQPAAKAAEEESVSGEPGYAAPSPGVPGGNPASPPGPEPTPYPYGPHAGYPPHPGYGPQQGYAPQPGYGPPEGYPHQGYAPPGHPPPGHPPPGHPSQGHTPEGYPHQGYAPQGYPPPGHPPEGYPPPGHPSQGYPPPGPPSQGHHGEGSPSQEKHQPQTEVPAGNAPPPRPVVADGADLRNGEKNQEKPSTKGRPAKWSW